jgi:hypothetical protein
VYVAGYQKEGEKTVSQLWKNGKAVTLKASQYDTFVQSLFVAGSDVYMVGYEDVKGKPKATLWKNGEQTSLTDGSSDMAIAFDVKVEGEDVYAAGFDGHKAILWKNGKPTEYSNDEKNACVNSVFIVKREVTK